MNIKSFLAFAYGHYERVFVNGVEVSIPVLEYIANYGLYAARTNLDNENKVVAFELDEDNTAYFNEKYAEQMED